MICEAAFWHDTPCAVGHHRGYHSMADALDDFRSMARDSERFGGAQPVGHIIRTDGAEFSVGLGPRGGVYVERMD